jgi:sugar lactone lactonase YvrE
MSNVKSAARTLTACIIASFVLRAHGANVYWIEANFSAPKLVMANAAGTTTSTLPLASGSLPQALAVSPGTNAVFWTELAFLNAHVKFAGASLADSGVAVSLQSCGRGVAIDSTNKKLYWTSTNLSAGPGIFRANLDGTSAEQIQSFGAASLHTPFAIALDEKTQTLFWTDFGSGAIVKAPATPLSAYQPIVTGLSGPVGIVFDADSSLVFWTEANAGNIGRSKPDGSGKTTIVTNCSRPQYISLDRIGRRLFWTESGANLVRSSRLDGTDTLTLAHTAFPPCGIAVSAGQLTLSRPQPGALRSPETYGVSVSGPADRSGAGAIRIRYRLPAAGRAVIEVFDLSSRRVWLAAAVSEGAGYYQKDLGGRVIGPGAYLVRFRANSFTSTMRVTVVR